MYSYFQQVLMISGTFNVYTNDFDFALINRIWNIFRNAPLKTTDFEGIKYPFVILLLYESSVFYTLHFLSYSASRHGKS